MVSTSIYLRLWTKKEKYQNMSSSSSRTVVIDNLPHFTVTEQGTVIRLIATEVSPPNPNDFTEGAKSKDITVDADTGVFVRMYLPSCEENERIPVLFYIHGGGFSIASADCTEYHKYMNKVASHVRALCISVDYRRCPEHRLPVAYDDCFGALRWLLAGPGKNDPWIEGNGDLSRVFIAGDSAGGNIVHELGLRARRAELGSKLSAILVQPFFRVNSTPTEEDENWIEFCLPSGEDMDYPPFNPFGLRSPPVSELSYERILVCVAEMDCLREGAEFYYSAVVDADFKAELLVCPGEDHAFHLFKLESPSTVEMLNRIRDFVRPV